MGNRAPSGGGGDQSRSRTSVGSRSTAGGAAVGGAAGGQKGGNSEEKKTNPEQKAKPNVYTYTSPQGQSEHSETSSGQTSRASRK